MNICPNLSNKQIKAEFDQLVKIFGEDCAYLLWDRSNGMGLKLAPNGASSKLYQDLLKLHNGDERAALIDKAKIYTNTFKGSFGNWINRPEGIANAIDENQEPLLTFVARQSTSSSLHSASYHISYAEKARILYDRIKNKYSRGGFTLYQAKKDINDFNKKYGTHFGVFEDKEGKYTQDGKPGIFVKRDKNHEQADSEGPDRNTSVLGTRDAQSVIGFLNKMFPELQVVQLSHEEFVQNASEFGTGFISGKYVVLDMSRVNIEVIAEEFFHPFVECFAIQQPDVYNQLLKQAKEEFPELDKAIQDTYKRLYYKKEDFEKELVTQALSRYFSAQLNGDVNKHNRLDEVINKFITYLKDLLGLPGTVHKNGNTIAEIKKLESIVDLQDLATILNTQGLTFSVKDGVTEPKKRRYHIENTRQDESVNTSPIDKPNSIKNITSLELKQRLKQLGEEREKQCRI